MPHALRGHDRPDLERGDRRRPFEPTALSHELGDEREQDRHDQDDAESDPQPADARWKLPLALGMALEPFQEGDPVGDAAVPPRSTGWVQPVAPGDVRQGVGEDPDPDRAELGSLPRTGSGDRS